MRGVIWDGSRLHVTGSLEVRAPGPREVRVRVLASGICHSDLNMMDSGLLKTPVVLGHEAAGVVEQTGAGVRRVRVGDPVMVSCQTPCGTCRECERRRFASCDQTFGLNPGQPFTWENGPIYSFANCSSFAGQIVVKDSQLFHTRGLAPTSAAIIGCAVSTGYNAARRLGEVEKDDVVVVLGVGGIGVNAILGARIAGAGRIVAADVNPEKEGAARHFGADAFVVLDRDWAAGAAVERIRAATAAPIDVAIECSGAKLAVESALRAPKRGGTSVLVGMPAPGTVATFDVLEFTGGRKVVSTMNGGTDPARDFPHLIDLIRSGTIDTAAQITRVWPLGQIEDAVKALRAGQVTRALLDHTR